MRRQISTIFCDDIRQEVGGKLSLMGVYSGVMFLQALPATLPKLCVSLTALTSTECPFQKISFKILKGDDLLVENDLDANQLIESSKNQDGSMDDGKDKIQLINMALVFSPLNIEEECVIRVRVYADGEELRGPGLTIKLADSELLGLAK